MVFLNVAQGPLSLLNDGCGSSTCGDGLPNRWLFNAGFPPCFDLLCFFKNPRATINVAKQTALTMKTNHMCLSFYVLSTFAVLANSFDPVTTTIVVGAGAVLGRRILNYFQESCDTKWISFNSTGERLCVRQTFIFWTRLDSAGRQGAQKRCLTVAVSGCKTSSVKIARNDMQLCCAENTT